jgi:hypothetical protein
VVDKLTPGSQFHSIAKSGSAGRASFVCIGPLFLYQEISHKQGIHAGAEKRANGVGRRIHDWLTAKIE